MFFVNSWKSFAWRCYIIQWQRACNMSWKVDTPKYYSLPQRLLLWQLANCRMSMFSQQLNNEHICQEFQKRVHMHVRNSNTPVEDFQMLRMLGSKWMDMRIWTDMNWTDKICIYTVHFLLISLSYKCVRGDHWLTARVIRLWDCYCIENPINILSSQNFIWIFHKKKLFTLIICGDTKTFKVLIGCKNRRMAVLSGPAGYPLQLGNPQALLLLL